MSSLTHETKSRTGWRLRVYTAAGRRSIWLGRIEKSEAIAIQRHIDEIIASQTADIPIPRATVQWMDRQSHELRHKLTAIIGAAQTVRTAIDVYLDDRRPHLADSSYDDRSRSLEILADQFGSRHLEGVAIGDIQSAHDAIAAAPSTRGKIAIHWKSFFAWCVDRHLIAENPARVLSTAIGVREKHFVPSGIIAHVLEECTDPELGLIIAISRFGGIRISSEIRSMEWSHVDRTTGRIKIIDSKRGRDREIPIGLTIAHQLEIQPAGELLATYRHLSHATITARFESLLVSCGVATWSPLWHSMRATRETEWIQQFGIAVASQWIGNSAAVALRSYAMVPDNVWATATQGTTDRDL